MTPKPEKTNLHPRNPHRFGYDLTELSAVCPELKPLLTRNVNGQETIDFSDPTAVKVLNHALLTSFYQVKKWDIPQGYLCPAIPGRADYIHNMADLLASSNNGIVPKGKSVAVLDIGTGASGVYPIIGYASYGWSFVGTDIDPDAIANVAAILESNAEFGEAISLQQQLNSRVIFKEIIQPEDKFAFTMCNPPFHSSKQEATKGTLRKLSNLENKKPEKAVLNFGGQQSELWCEGGELAFITQMAYESAKFPLQCLWYSTLVSQARHIAAIQKILDKVGASDIRILGMSQGQKTSRVVAWTFHSKAQQSNWKF